MRHPIHTHVARRGLSFLELQVAFVLLGITLAGVVPLMIMQTRQVRAIEDRLSHWETYYFVPVEPDWARRLGVPAEIEAIEPGKASVGTLVEPVQELTVLLLKKLLTEEAVAVRVRVREIGDAEESVERRLVEP